MSWRQTCQIITLASYEFFWWNLHITHHSSRSYGTIEKTVASAWPAILSQTLEIKSSNDIQKESENLILSSFHKQYCRGWYINDKLSGIIILKRLYSIGCNSLNWKALPQKTKSRNKFVENFWRSFPKRSLSGFPLSNSKLLPFHTY